MHTHPNSCTELRKRLLRWYAKNSRDLPWRRTSDPYCIWISEIMLQQTTVKAVIPYYERFLARFPDVQSLAKSSESEVLKHWEGLGYYSRGRNLRLAAQRICEDHQGEFPSDLVKLQNLPGIGRYTAGAIRSFGFDLPAPIVEANTLRLYCRLLGYEGDPRSQEGQALLWKFAETLQPRKRAGHVNQALMELGSVLCTPSEPDCEECPLKIDCSAFQTGRQSTIPVKVSRPQVTQTVEASVAVQDGERWLIRQRGTQERWAGMWDFLRFPIESISSQEKLSKAALTKLTREARQRVEEQCHLQLEQLEHVKDIRHSVTRYRIRLMCLVAECGAECPKPKAGQRWVMLQELKSLPMPVTGRQFAELLAKR